MPHVSELHAQHDLLLVASLAAGDLAGADRDLASAQIADCNDCAALHADLIDIARATAALPPAVAPRDFRLSPEQAAALRPLGWRRLVAAIGGSRPLMSRQLGIGLATIGLAGLLVSTLPGINLGGSAAAPPQRTSVGAPVPTTNDLAGQPDQSAGTTTEAASAAAAQAAPAASGVSSGDSTTLAPAPSSGGGRGSDYGPIATTPTASGDGVFGVTSVGKTATDGPAAADQNLVERSTASDGGRRLLLAGSIVLLAAGIALLVIRRFARRPMWS